jgi:hypothetical protein
MAADEQQIAQIEEELNGAKRDLKQTLSTVEAKVSEEAETVLSPRKLIQDNLIGASCVAGLLGFVAGSGKYRKVTAATIVVVIGYAVWNEFATVRSDNHHGGEPINSEK